MADKQSSSSNIAGIVVGGCLFIGMGVGMFTGHTSTGLFVGLGVGLLGMAAVLMFYRGKPEPHRQLELPWPGLWQRPHLMRSFLTTLIICCAIAAQSQTISFAEWQVLSEQDMRLLPRYGDKQKNAEQVASDEEFVRLTLASGGAPKQASEHLVNLGFELLRGGNMVHAMYRFNQAYLVRPTSSEVYAGYGAFFMSMDRPIEAHEQYNAGLAMDSTNTRLLTGEATVQLHDRYQYQLEESDRQAERCLATATKLLTRSFELDPKNADTAYKLAVCQEALMNCQKAWYYYDLSQTLGVQTSDESFPTQLKKTCPR